MALSAFLAILLLSALVSLFLTRPLWQGTAQEPAYSLPYLDSLAPSLDYFFIPHALRTVLGQPSIPYAVSLISLPVYIGLSTLFLAALGFATRRDRIARGFVWMALCALLLALGPRLRWDGEPVLIPVPAQVERLFTAGMRILSTQLASTPMPSYYALRVPSRIYIPLPALALQLFVPFLSKMRLWSRFALVLCLPLAVLAGMGVSYLLSHVRCVLKAHGLANTRPGDMMERVLGVGLVCAVFLESAILPYHMGYSEARPQAVDLWLADQEGDFAIAEFPYEKQLSGAYLFYRTVFHGKSLCSGSQPFAPEGHRMARALLYAFPSVGTTELLKTWGPKYVLVGSREYGNQWDQVQREIAAQPDLRLVTVFDDVPIYHDASLWNLIPGYDRHLVADRVYVYELDSEEGTH